MKSHIKATIIYASIFMIMYNVIGRDSLKNQPTPSQKQLLHQLYLKKEREQRIRVHQDLKKFEHLCVHDPSAIKRVFSCWKAKVKEKELDILNKRIIDMEQSQK